MSKTKWFGVLLASIVCAGAAWAGPLDGSVWNGGARQKRFIVGFVPGVGSKEQAGICDELGIPAGDYVKELDAVITESPSGQARPLAMVALRSNPKVRYVEEDFYAHWIDEAPATYAQFPLATAEHLRWLGDIQGAAKKIREHASPMGGHPVLDTPADPKDHIPWGIRRVHAPQAWDRAQGQGVRVAVIDTGIDCGHPDLTCARDGNGQLVGYNVIDSSKPPMDDHGHGTHVAGTIGAHMNGKYVGVAPMAELVPVKVLDASGGGNLSGVVKGIVWAAHHGFPVANMSLGSDKGSVFMKAAVMYAHYKGMAIIAAAGNGGEENKPVSYPGAYPEVIAVAASGMSPQGHDNLAFFSSRGPQVAFIAPGVNVWSLAPMNMGGYANHSGTSMATPHVTGLAALAISRGIQGPDELRAAFTRAAKPLGLDPDPKKDKEQEGAGMIDAELLVR